MTKLQSSMTKLQSSMTKLHSRSMTKLHCKCDKTTVNCLKNKQV